MQNVVPVEHREQTVHCSRRVTLAGLNVFPQDAPSILNGTNQRVLVGVIHDATQLLKLAFKVEDEFSFPVTLRFNVSEAVAIGRAFCQQPRRIREAPRG
jgi:hypothetical protein